MDDAFHLCLVCGGKRFGIRIGGKEFVAQAVYGNVGCLCGENCHNQQLEVVSKLQEIHVLGGVGICRIELLKNVFCGSCCHKRSGVAQIRTGVKASQTL